MKNLTEFQKEFLLTNFFKNSEFENWKSIGYKLLTNGTCIIAGTKRPWSGGVGNFIDIELAENTIGCSLCTFNAELFFRSAWYVSTMGETLYPEILELKHRVTRECSEIEDLLK